MKKILPILRNKTHLLLSAAITGILITISLSYFYHQNLSRHNLLNNTTQGLHTCFTRVGQSFTAFMIGNQFSPYLRPGFTSVTGECFGEVNNIFNDQMAATYQAYQDQLNIISNDIHWFSKELLKAEAINAENLSEKNLVSRKFTKIENDINGLYDLISKEQSALKTNMSRLDWALIFSGIFLIFIWFLFLIERSNVLALIANIETEASGYLNKKKYQIQQAQNLWNQIVKLNHLKQSEVFFQYFLNDLRDNALVKTNDEMQSSVESRKTESVEASPEELIRSSEVNQFKIISVNGVVMDIIEQLAQQAFSKGIMINFVNEEEVYVWSSPEALQQVVYSLFLKSFDACLMREQKRNLHVRLKTVGDQVWLDLSIDGHCFNSSELDFMNSNFPQKLKIDKNLVLAKELSSDINGSLILSNQISDNSQTMKALFKMTLQKADYQEESVDAAPRLKTIIKGKKAEVLRKIKELRI